MKSCKRCGKSIEKDSLNIHPDFRFCLCRAYTLEEVAKLPDLVVSHVQQTLNLCEND